MNICRLVSSALVLCVAAIAVDVRPPQTTPLTEVQKIAIQKEIRQISRDWIDANERVDYMGVVAFYKSIPDFSLIHADSNGKLMDFDDFQKNLQESFHEIICLEVILRRETFTVMDAGTVLWAFQGAWLETRKSGKVKKADPCATSVLFRRVGANWKIVYQHDSFHLPAEVEPMEVESSVKGVPDAQQIRTLEGRPHELELSPSHRLRNCIFFGSCRK